MNWTWNPRHNERLYPPLIQIFTSSFVLTRMIFPLTYDASFPRIFRLSVPLTYSPNVALPAPLKSFPPREMFRTQFRFSLFPLIKTAALRKKTRILVRHTRITTPFLFPLRTLLTVSAPIFVLATLPFLKPLLTVVDIF